MAGEGFGGWILAVGVLRLRVRKPRGRSAQDDTRVLRERCRLRLG